MRYRTGASALSEAVMGDFVAKEPLILFEIGKALSEGRFLPEAVQGWWVLNQIRAETDRLVLGKASGKIVCAYRPFPGSWHQRDDGRWGFGSIRADDVWDEYVGKTVPDQYRGGQNPVRYVSPIDSGQAPR